MKAVLKNNVTDKIIEVTSTTDHPDSSYGQPVWVDAQDNAYCIVGMENPLYEVISMSIDDREALGTMVRHLRIMKNISIRELAEKCGLSKSTIVNIESGAYSPRLEVINKIVSTLGAKISLTVV